MNLSTGLSKSFTITEQLRLRAEGTFTNVLNHTNLGDPDMNLRSPDFGLISGTVGNNGPNGTVGTVGTDFGGARTGQVAVRLEFLDTGKDQKKSGPPHKEWWRPAGRPWISCGPGLEDDLRDSLEDARAAAGLRRDLSEGA